MEAREICAKLRKSYKCQAKLGRKMPKVETGDLLPHKSQANVWSGDGDSTTIKFLPFLFALSSFCRPTFMRGGTEMATNSGVKFFDSKKCGP